MFNTTQISDYEYEKALEEFWDCSEIMNEEWPDDLWDE